MVVRKKKKVTKYRGSHYHGAGHRKKRRGAGSRGGRGMAGSGKRAGQKKAGIGNTLGSVGGKKGFTSHHRSVTKGLSGVNVSYFTVDILERLVSQGLAIKQADSYAVDLKALKLGKLLGAGKFASKVTFTCLEASAKAVEKVQAAGGSVAVLGQEASA